jgi:hypothetical protein
MGPSCKAPTRGQRLECWTLVMFPGVSPAHQGCARIHHRPRWQGHGAERARAPLVSRLTATATAHSHGTARASAGARATCTWPACARCRCLWRSSRRVPECRLLRTCRRRCRTAAGCGGQSSTGCAWLAGRVGAGGWGAGRAAPAVRSWCWAPGINHPSPVGDSQDAHRCGWIALTARRRIPLLLLCHHQVWAHLGMPGYSF